MKYREFETKFQAIHFFRKYYRLSAMEASKQVDLICNQDKDKDVLFFYDSTDNREWY